MFNFSLESFVGNFSFILLFLIMFFYWFQAIFDIIPKFPVIIILLTLCANFNLIILLIIRWFSYKHFPLSNLYESLIFLSWSFNLIQLIFLYSKFDLNKNFQPSFILTKNSDFSTEIYQKTRLKDFYLTQKTSQTSNMLTEKKIFRFASKNFKALVKNFKNLINTITFSTANTGEKKIYNTNQYNVSLSSSQQIMDSKKFLIMIGTILSPMALFTNSFANFSLPKNMQKAQALVPALQSNWLMMHVTVMMLSYTALLFGSLLSISFLILNWITKKQKSIQMAPNTIKNTINIIDFSNISNYSVETTSISNNLNQITNNKPQIYPNFPVFLKNEKLVENNPFTNQIVQPQSIQTLTKTLDNLSYRILGLGFPLLTIGILSGAVWANEAWGSYWSWDPKETWAFITWLVFAMYLHGRIIKKWEGQKPAIVASLGFFVVWICYLGVNILGTGLHTYGWLK